MLEGEKRGSVVRRKERAVRRSRLRARVPPGVRGRIRAGLLERRLR